MTLSPKMAACTHSRMLTMGMYAVLQIWQVAKHGRSHKLQTHM